MSETLPPRDDSSLIPSAVPEETGAEGSQRKAVTGEVLPPEVERRASMDLAVAIKGAVAEARGLRGSDLIVANFRNLQSELDASRKECRDLRDRLEAAQQKFSDEHTKCEVLSERLKSNRFVKVLSGFCTTVGGSLFGVGATGKFGDESAVLMFIGGVLVLVGAVASFWPEGKP